MSLLPDARKRLSSQLCAFTTPFNSLYTLANVFPFSLVLQSENSIEVKSCQQANKHDASRCILSYTNLKCTRASTDNLLVRTTNSLIFARRSGKENSELLILCTLEKQNYASSVSIARLNTLTPFASLVLHENEWMSVWMNEWTLHRFLAFLQIFFLVS